MTPLKFIAYAFALVAFGCKTDTKTPQFATNPSDYNHFLNVEKDTSLDVTKQDYAFWKNKLQQTPNQYPYWVKAASAQSQLFQKTGKIGHLITAGKHLVAANTATHYSNSSYLRALARNYISQHKFKEALKLLEKAEAHGDRLKATQKMLFDVHLELGNDGAANRYLNCIENFDDFDFLIRYSKWNDHKGHLDKAILYLEKATEMVETYKNKTLQQWAYTNLADFYGHAGQIQASYKHYLKALELNPNDAYAKRGIAWITYSYEKNPDEALRILNAISQSYNAPDYHLLKAEIAEFKGDDTLRTQEIMRYKSSVSNYLYGAMYNKYNVLLLADANTDTQNLLKIAETEIKNRPTAQSFDLMAWVYFNGGQKEKALHIMENHVVGKTFEPETLFHLAQIYKANGKQNEALLLKNELLESRFELGPVMTKKIENI